MEWIHTITMTAAICGFLWYFLSNVQRDIQRLDKDMQACNNRIDQAMARIDRLYEMFVDLLKERKDER